MSNKYDVAVIGAGPIGIATARACAEKGMRAALIDKGAICDALYHYPTHMRFFSTSERIAINNIPFPSPQPQPTRIEALHYYRLVAQYPGIDWHLYQAVTAVDGTDGAFTVHTQKQQLAAKKVVVATGFFNRPVMLDVPGEDLPHVSHYFVEGHPYAGQDLVIIGAANSAVIAALECWRNGARVHIVHHGGDFRAGVKYWLRPDVENRIQEGSIQVSWHTSVKAIEPGRVLISRDSRDDAIPADFVLAMTGYRSDYSWLQSLGIGLGEGNRPRHHADTLESSDRAGVYLAGCVLCGDKTNDLFIENGRIHAEQIAAQLSRHGATHD